jgi:RNA polymerase sigma-70 factor (ECF subfamily)
MDLADPHVFARAYRRHRRAVVATAWRVVRDRELAEDIAQDVFTWLWRHPRAYDGRTSLAAYLAVIARSRAIDAWRSADARVRLDDRLRHEAAARAAADGEGVVAALIRRDDDARLRGLVAELSDGQRQAVALTYWAELPMTTVAARLGVPADTVKSRVRLARARLAERLRPVAV